MKLQSLFVRTSLLISSTLLLPGAPRVAAQAQTAGQSSITQTPAVPARITQAIDETQLVRLKGNVHPLARPEFDQGPVADSMLATRMLLLLQRSPDQEASLQQLLEDQQNKGSAGFHKWLTPQQYGAQFGPADADIQTVKDWLTRHGFQGIKVNAGRTMIEFSGTVGQVRSAFHTEIHRYAINGEMRQANSADPQIPAALAPVVKGVAGLHNFPPKAFSRRLGTFRRNKATGEVKPLFTYNPGSGDIFAIGPTDFATIYNVAPLWNATPPIDGTGESIALVGDSNINIQDVRDFRTMFGLPAKDPQVIVNGPDPGLNGDEIEADLDVQWAGSVAKNAQIILVVTEQPFTIGAAGVDLSAEYIIDNNLAPVMSESFGLCEAFANNQLENALWQQASAQGITAMVAAGDNGSAGCDPSPVNPLVATQGLAISGNASTPFNVATGGTDFNSSLASYASTYWNTSNASTTESSAKSYIPEITWNDTCASTGSTTACTATVINNDATNFGPGIDVAAGSGGSSAIYTGASNKPSWQTGLGDANRDIPDVSLFAGNGFNNSFYVFCEQDANAAFGGSPTSCDLNSPFLDFQGVGGTSGSSPTFAGIMALVNQKTGSRQGNANYTLYSMYKTASNVCTSNAAAVSNANCIFYDLGTGSGNISVACQGGSPNCSNTSTVTTQFGIMATTTGGTTPAYNTAAGYDLATGLGSVNAANLINHWASPTFTASSTTFTLNSGAAVSITHGASVTVSGTVSGSGGTPTGIVNLVQVSTGDVIDTFTLSGGSYSGSTRMLPGTNGTAYQVKAHYGGDGKFAASDSSPQSVSSVAKENSAVTVSFVTFTAQGAPILSTAAQNLPYGSAYILRVDVTNSANQPCSSTAGIPCPTGTVTELDNGQPLNDFLVAGTSTPTNTTSLTNQGLVEDQPVQLTGGAHSVTASYSGDASFNAQPTSNTLSVTITPAATAIALGASQTTGVTTSTPVTFTATLSSNSNSATGTTGTVTFFNNGTQIGTATATQVPAVALAGAGGTATFTTTFTSAGTKSITASYGGDTNYLASGPSSPAISITVTQATTGSFTLSATPASTLAGNSASSTIMVIPSGGFTGTVTISCSTLPPGVTANPNCAASPSAFTITVPSSGNGMGTLTLPVAAPSSSTSASVLPAERTLRWAGLAPAIGGGKGWWGLSGVTGLAAILLLLLPGRKRYRAALALGLICVLSFTLGCSSGYGTGGGPSPTTTKISVTSTKVAQGTIAFTVNVTSTGTRMPTGSVQLYDGTSILGTSMALSGGSATISISTLSVGTHAISAHYVGDTYSQLSQSGALNMAITGSTTVSITGTSGSTTANGTVNLTIN